ILRGLLAGFGLVLIVASSPAGTRGQETHGRYGDQPQRGGPLDQTAAVDAAGGELAGAVVLGGGGSHAQVLAFSRTQAVNRILPGTAFGSSWVVLEVLSRCCGAGRSRCTSLMVGRGEDAPECRQV